MAQGSQGDAQAAPSIFQTAFRPETLDQFFAGVGALGIAGKIRQQPAAFLGAKPGADVFAAFQLQTPQHREPPYLRQHVRSLLSRYRNGRY